MRMRQQGNIVERVIRELPQHTLEIYQKRIGEILQKHGAVLDIAKQEPANVQQAIPNFLATLIYTDYINKCRNAADIGRAIQPLLEEDFNVSLLVNVENAIRNRALKDSPSLQKTIEEALQHNIGSDWECKNEEEINAGIQQIEKNMGGDKFARYTMYNQFCAHQGEEKPLQLLSPPDLVVVNDNEPKNVT